MLQPVASVVVPVFNRLNLLEQVLDAFPPQRSNMPFEVIVVDDGSEPPAATVIAGRDERFRLLVQANRGRSAAINAGLATVRGEIVIVCDADIVPSVGFVEEHLAFHRNHPAVEETHLGAVTWGVAAPPFAALLGPRSNPRMAGLEGPLPWPLWYTDNWSFKRQLLDSGVVRFDETFHDWGWEDLELAYRLNARGIRNHCTSTAEGRHLQAPTLDSMLQKFAGSVPNLLHLATCVGRDKQVDNWLTLQRVTPLAVQAGESILRRTVAHVESLAAKTAGPGPAPPRILSTSLSDAVFRCGIQQGFLQSKGEASDVSEQDFVQAVILPYADLVRHAIAALLDTGDPVAAGELLDFSRRSVVDGGGDDRLVSAFAMRSTRGLRRRETR
jgi:hypothetical protein